MFFTPSLITLKLPLLAGYQPPKTIFLSAKDLRIIERVHCDALVVTSNETLAVPNERQSWVGGIRELGIPGAQIKRGRLHEMNHNILGDTRLLSSIRSLCGDHHFEIFQMAG